MAPVRALAARERVALLAPLVAGGLLFLFGLVTVARYAVDIPVMDDWEFLNSGVFVPRLDWHWVFSPHNEHRIIFTNLINWLSYRWDRWNIVHLTVLNWCIYLGTVWSAHSLTRILPPEERRPLAWFYPLLFVPLAAENHLWAFQSQFHLFLLFFFLAVSQLFAPCRSPLGLAAGVASAVCAVYAFSSGVVCALVLLATFAVWHLRQPARTQGDGWRLLGVILGIGLAAGIWILNFEKPAHHPPLILPTHFFFWWYYANVLSLGFGSTGVTHLKAAAFCVLTLALTAATVGRMLRRCSSDPGRESASEGVRDVGVWRVGTAVLGVLASLGTIALGRAGFHDIAQAKSLRYAEVSAFLVPLVAAMLLIALRGRPEKWRRAALATLWIVVAIHYAPKMDPRRQYVHERARRTAGVACVAEYYRAGGPGDCPSLYPGPLAERLEIARGLGLSFYVKSAPGAGRAPPPAERASAWPSSR